MGIPHAFGGIRELLVDSMLDAVEKPIICDSATQAQSLYAPNII